MPDTERALVTCDCCGMELTSITGWLVNRYGRFCSTGCEITWRAKSERQVGA